MLAPLLLAAARTCDPNKAICRDTAGPGIGLKIFFVVSVIGIVLVGWLILRGYRDQDDRRDQ